MNRTRVLFIDDEPNILESLRRSLRKQSSIWNMEFASSGEEALRILGRDSFDVIVTDLRMPGMSGEELLETITPLYPHLVQLILSGAPQGELGGIGTTGSIPFLAKPCPPDVLVTTIQRGLFLSSFFKSHGTLQKLLESLDTLQCISEIVIKVRALPPTADGRSVAVAEVVSAEMGVHLRFGLEREKADLAVGMMAS